MARIDRTGRFLLGAAALAVLAGCGGSGGGSSSVGGSTSGSTSGSTTTGTTGPGAGVGPGPGSIASDFDAPQVEITTPARGEYLSGQASVQVTGRASDGQGSGLAAFTLAGTMVPVDAQGNFQATIPLDAGVNTLVARGVDYAGNVGAASVSVLYSAGPYRLATEEIPGAAGVRLSETALNAAAPTIAQQIVGSGAINQQLTAQPLYRGDVRDPIFNTCLASAEVRVLGIAFDVPTIAFDAVPGGFNADVHVRNFRVDANSRSYCGIGYSVTGNVSSTDVAIQLGLDVSLSGTQYIVTKRSSSLTLNGFRWGINNIPSLITNIVQSMVRREIEKRLQEVLDREVAQRLQQTLQGLGQPISRTFNGKVVTFRATPSALGFDDTGLTVELEGNVTAARAANVPLVPGSFFLPPPAGQVPSFANGAGFYASANENILNRALFTSWQAGYWTILMDQAFFQQFGVNLPFSLDGNLIAAFFPAIRGMITPGQQVPVAIRFDPRIQPLVRMTGTPDLARVALGELHMELLMDFGAGYQPIFEAALHLDAGATASFTPQNELRFVINQGVRFEADVVSMAMPLNGIDVERFLSFLVPPAITVATQTIAPIPLPAPQGISITNMAIYRDGVQGEFLTVSGDVR